MKAHIKAALLAGGSGSRLCGSKSDCAIGKLDRHVQGIPLGLRSYLSMRRAFPDPMIICRPEQVPGCLSKFRVAFDWQGGQGPASGIVTALENADDWCFIAAADMPFLNDVMIKEMAEVVERLPEDSVCAVPLWRKGLEPLHAFYRRRANGRIKEYAAGTRRSMIGLTISLGAVSIDAEQIARSCGCDIETAFFNVNSPEDFERAGQLARTAGDILPETGGSDD